MLILWDWEKNLRPSSYVAFLLCRIPWNELNSAEAQGECEEGSLLSDEEIRQQERKTLAGKVPSRQRNVAGKHNGVIITLVIWSMSYAVMTTLQRNWSSPTPKTPRTTKCIVKVQKEVKKRYTGSSPFPYTTAQMRTKFKRCVAECKKLALTIKTGTGIKRIQEERGYGAWFCKLFALVQSRDSYNPELAEEPSHPSTHNNATSTAETSPEDEGKKLFVPRKRSKEKDDVLTTVVDMLKDMSQQNTVADLQKKNWKGTLQFQNCSIALFLQWLKITLRKL